MVNSFSELGLNEDYLQAVERLGYTQPTPIQVETIPLMLSSRDILAQSQTGTGKTAAFMLPILQRLKEGNGITRALVLAPTRELAKQVADATEGLCRGSGIKVLAVYGGQSYEIQIRALTRGVDILVGTPGRLLDFIRQGRLDLNRVETLVLDEADEMLEMGFIDDVETILKELPERRQMALFSATLPAQIQKLAAKYLTDAVKISINPSQVTVAETEQRLYRVREETKLAALCCLLETDEVTSGLIFTRTKARAQELADELLHRGISADSLHGDLNQSRRELVLNRFRRGSVTLMVATDVAARGLDIQDVSHVFNYDMPADAEDYVHRIGRTGRAGKKGIAITLLTPRERGRMNQIQAYTRQPVNEVQLPGAVEVQQKRDERLIEQVSGQLLAGINHSEKALLEQMLANGFNINEVAVGLIRLLRANSNETPIKELLEISKLPVEKTHAAEFTGNGKRTVKGNHSFSTEKKDGVVEQGMVRLWMSLGNRNGLRPGDIVGAIAGESGIPGKAIGEINIQTNYSLVDVAENHVQSVLKSSKRTYKIKGRPVQIRLADLSVN
jgi:ATP-dependent RNA helicase DeaD